LICIFISRFTSRCGVMIGGLFFCAFYLFLYIHVKRLLLIVLIVAYIECSRRSLCWSLLAVRSFFLSKKVYGMCISVITHQCSRYIDMLIWHVLVISFHLFDMMTDVKVLENKSDWMPSLLLFFLARLLLLPHFIRLSFMFDIGNHHHYHHH